MRSNDRFPPSLRKFLPMRETAARYYSDRIRRFGATARGVDWNSEEGQTLRFEQLLKLVDDREPVSINDYGCGYGALAAYLRRCGRQWRYTGFDISDEMIAQSIATHGADPLCAFTSDPGALEPAAYTFASGVFNVKLDHSADAWQEYTLETLDMMDRVSEHGFAFNILSSYADPQKQRANLFYGHPGFFFDHCKTRYSPRVALLHDYPLDEFSILVRK